MSFEHRLRTRYSETGQDGIIHHSSYVVYLEEARLEFFKTLGCDVNELEKKRIFCPVTDLSIKYLKPLFSLEDIQIQVALAEVSKVRFGLNYRLFRNGTCTAKATSVHCFVNASFKPMRLSAIWGDKIADSYSLRNCK